MIRPRSLRAAHERAELARRGVRVPSHEADPQLRELDDLVHRIVREARAKSVLPIRGAKIYDLPSRGAVAAPADGKTSGSVCESGSEGVLVPLFPAEGGASTNPFPPGDSAA